MDIAHVRTIRDLCNDEDYAINTTIEDGLMQQIDDEMTYIKSTRAAKSSYPTFDIDDAPRIPKKGSDTFLFDDESDASSTKSSIFNDPLGDFTLDPAMSRNNKIAQNIYKSSSGKYTSEAADTLYGYEEEKAEYIENINRMLVSLKEMGVSVDDIPEVNDSTQANVVHRVYKQISKRYDSILYSDTGSDIIVGVCQCLEGIFNGRRVLFGIRPDLTGWTDQYVRPHMTHFRHETSRMVADYVEKLGFSRFAKILILLIPGSLVFMATGRNTTGFKTSDYGNAMNNLGSKK
jgi:hypothetical protein